MRLQLYGCLSVKLMSESRTEGADVARTDRQKSRWFYALFLSPLLVFIEASAIVYAGLINAESTFVLLAYMLGTYLAFPISILTHIGLFHETRRMPASVGHWWRYLILSFILGIPIFTHIAIQRPLLLEAPVRILGGYTICLNISVIPSVFAYLYKQREA